MEILGISGWLVVTHLMALVGGGVLYHLFARKFIK